MPFSVLAALTAVSFQLHAAELPADIEWVSNNNEPLFASEEAVYGGTYRTYIESFPQTLRSVGPDANSGLRQYLMDGTPKWLNVTQIRVSGFLNWLSHGHLVKIIKRFILSLMTLRNGLMVRRSRPMIMFYDAVLHLKRHY